ncbi:polyisoprenoid diphosphate/phosphate phosphohydrolase PLPP6-like [Palaemon carinicauda]|uniref:polyisoprenoid diphosphate/phosphate phosphohydrolase PLPP6-like n=1 Tax=Palaemon carinicauda TaxID=392227 RepID=UPI0035B67C58
MGEKRDVPKPLKKVLDWDVVATEKFVKYVDQKYGPLTKFKSIMKGLEISCHGIPWLVGTATFIFFFDNPSVRQLLVNIFLALILDIIIVAVLKAVSRRRRPSDNKDDMFATVSVDKFSFPSGHATRAVMLSFLIPFQYSLWMIITLALICWSLAVCISRVLLRRHHILDVAGGMCIGILEACLMSLLWLSPEGAQGLVNFFLDETQVGASFDV